MLDYHNKVRCRNALASIKCIQTNCVGHTLGLRPREVVMPLRALSVFRLTTNRAHPGAIEIGVGRNALASIKCIQTNGIGD